MYWKQVYYDAVKVNWNKEIDGKPNLMLIQCCGCATICVDEILECKPANPDPGIYYELYSDREDEATQYWQQVKQEIQKLYDEKRV